MNPQSKRNQLDTELQILKKRLDLNNDSETARIVDELKAVLTKIDEDQIIQSPSQTVTSRMAPAILKKIRRNTLRNEPYFDSMVTIHSPAPTIRGRPAMFEKYRDGIRESQDFEEKSASQFDIDNGGAEAADEEPAYPIWIDIVPLILLGVVTVLYLILGTCIFQFMDPSLAKLHFYEVIFLPFMTGSTIGWGFIYPTINSSRIFLIIYGLVGVPLFHALFANFGRLFCQLYCYNFSFLIPFRDSSTTPSAEEMEKGVPPISVLPVTAVMHIIIIHSLVAVVVYTSYLDDLGVVQSIYFNFVAIACIGFGDISPKPQSLGGAIFNMAFVSLGLIVMSCFLVTTSLKLEYFFFDLFPSFLTDNSLKTIVFDKLHSNRSSKSSVHSKADKKSKDSSAASSVVNKNNGFGSSSYV